MLWIWCDVRFTLTLLIRCPVIHGNCLPSRKRCLTKWRSPLFPEHCNRLILANELGAFFKMKTSNIPSELDAAATVHNNHSTLAPSVNCFQPSSSLGFFSNFELLSKDSVKKLVLGVPTKSCSLEPVPTKVVKECLDELVLLLTVIINQSLQSGVFPDVWKEALVTLKSLRSVVLIWLSKTFALQVISNYELWIFARW